MCVCVCEEGGGGVMIKMGKSSGDCHNWETLDLGERPNVS